MTAVPAKTPATRRLPCRPVLRPGQALDSYLEVLAEANHTRTADLTRLIADATDTTRFFMLAPSRRSLQVLAALTDLTSEQLRTSVLSCYDGTVLDLEGLDPQRPSSHRVVSARGWLPGYGTQICPRCLRTERSWHLDWRLPTTTVCTRHHTYLLATCPGCGKPFRSTRHSFLRPIGAATICGNSRHARGGHCTTDLTTLHAPRADPDCLERQHRYDTALAEGTSKVLGEQIRAADYHHALRSLTTLLLHIATATDNPRGLPLWARRLNRDHRDHRGNPGARAPRWGIAPPTEPRLRSRALTAADYVLSAPDVEEATRRLANWYERIPTTPDGVLGWAGDHTISDPTTSRLITAVHAPRRRLSRALDARRPLTPALTNIPQMIPQDLYERHLVGMFTSRPETVRAFAALCLARSHPHVTTWADAAVALGLPGELGTKTAKACTAAQISAPSNVLTALRSLTRELPHRGYRDLEERVRALTHEEEWFSAWIATYRPGTPLSSKPYALTWLWTHLAGGHLSTSPARPTPPDPARRASYRRFAASLTAAQTHGLHDYSELWTGIAP